ncbi:HpcH/HpaI aldolase/citrate lyase family protein [Sphingomonas pruni]|uniref:HpcH/HpaI aldolase/citrate lyase family protein n=1 Tax=Sphingomonas pruni TaxID=40683 RepID=UPI00082EBE1F|nr:CoA ester lyase [Sphingomonas pruni]
MRSKLFVPCSRPEFFAKALAGDADALSFDLEDAVPEGDKAAARSRLVEWLRSDAVASSGKRMIVRINALDSPFFADDLAALAGIRVDCVNLPKASSPAAVRMVAVQMESAGIAADLLVNIETPRGISQAAGIAGAHPRVIGLQVGLNDLFASLGVDRRDLRHVQTALWSIRLAAGEAERFAFDGAWPDLADDDGFRAEAELARSLGYPGKSCIHPRQVTIANALFDTGEDVARARRLLAAAGEAGTRGHGAFLFEGAMADAPAVAAAREAVRRADGNEGTA